MIRVVLDTNIIVSALLQPLGPPAQIFVLAIGGSIQMCVSGSIYAEYEEVISRPRFQRAEDIIAGTLHAIREKGFWVRPTEALRVCSDPDDDIFLECAQASRADYYLCESHLECHRGFLRLDDYYVKVLTLKEPPAHSFPLIFQRLLEVEANFFVATEWKREGTDKSRSLIQSRRRHFHTTKRSFISYMNTSDAPASAQDVLVDDSKEAQIHELGEALKALEVKGNYFGKFSLTVVVHDLDRAKVERACANFYKVFSIHDAQLYEASVGFQPERLRSLSRHSSRSSLANRVKLLRIICSTRPSPGASREVARPPARVQA